MIYNKFLSNIIINIKNNNKKNLIIRYIYISYRYILFTLVITKANWNQVTN